MFFFSKYMNNFFLKNFFLQRRRSSSFGTLVLGGLHFTILVTYVLALTIPAFVKHTSRIFPAIPTNGLPFSSSFLPGASPINMTVALKLPSPGTALVLLIHRSHSLHFMTSSLILSIESFDLLIN